MSAEEGRKKAKKKKKKKTTKDEECADCGKRFYWPCQLKHHRMVHTGEKPYACKICGKSFNSNYTLKGHEYIHTNEKPYKCAYCDYACRDGSTLRKHQYNVHTGTEKMYQCKMCAKGFKDKWRLKMHVAEDHLHVNMHRLPCPHCGKRFKTNANLNLHVKTVHERRKTCECPICGKRLSSTASLPTHLLTHSDARPYRCTFDGCGKSYKDSSSLSKHVRVHCPDDQFACDACGRMFTRKIRLKYHWKTVHCKKKRVECDHCGTRFYSKNYLITHLRRKHSNKRKVFKCDLCRFVTHNKPSLVMHIKYGHVSESDRKCRICKTRYRKHAYLKRHYKRTHGIIYKTRKRPLRLEIKQEPTEEIPIDLFEIEKHELEPKLDPEPVDPQLDLINSELKEYMESDAMIKDIPDAYFEEFYVDRAEGSSEEKVLKVELQPTKYKDNIDKDARKIAKKEVEKLLGEAKERQTVKALEEARELYNRRMKELLGQRTKKETMKVKYFNKIRTAKVNNQTGDKDDGIKQPSDEDTSQTDDDDSKKAEVDETLHDNDKSKINDKVETTKAANDNDEIAKTEADVSNESEKNDDRKYEESDEDYKEPNAKAKTNKLNFNSHQCYICFKLYQTKETLLEHCKDHFDVCTTEKTLKKCPLCEYVTKLNLTRHLKLVHKVRIKLPSKLKDKISNTDSSRYYYEIDNPVVKNIEVIPSIKNLNNMASMKIDEKNRDKKANTVAKTKLVRKGKEWIVETEKMTLDCEVVMPEFDMEEVKKVKLSDTDSYFDSMKKLYHVAKKSGKKILFPCQKCDKICQNLAALKLHSRKHDPNAKPFKAKVWKHKLKGKIPNDRRPAIPAVNTDNRSAKPKPIENKHKCDKELKDFYTNNIRGGDIEFWQFLKIYNKMDRENIKDFTDLKDRYDFGVEHHLGEVNGEITKDENLDIEQTNNTDLENAKNKEQLKTKSQKELNQTKVRKLNHSVAKSKLNSHKRVIRISKAQFIKRNLAKQLLRDKLTKCVQS